MESLADIKQYTARGNELISLYIQPDDTISRVEGILKRELESLDDFDENKRMKYSLQKTLNKVLDELESLDEIPKNGLVIFAGRVRGDTELLMFSEELESEVEKTSYMTGSRFSTSIAEKLIPSRHDHGLILIELGNCLIGSIKSGEPEVLSEVELRIPSKHSKGGQSQSRFERRREESKKEFFSTCEKRIESNFDDGTIFIGGPNITVKEFLNATSIQNRYTVHTHSVEYVNRSGLQRLGDIALKHIQEQENDVKIEHLEEFLRYASSSEKPVVYGSTDVKTAMDYKAIRRLIVHKELENDDLLQEAERQGANVTILDGSSEKERIFKNSFGGIGAILDYEIQNAQ